MQFDGLMMGICVVDSSRPLSSVGEHVQEVAAGDTVVPVFLPQCGECDDCLSARSNICSVLTYRPGLMPRDGTTRFSLAATGEPVHTFLSVSSFTEYTVVDVGHVVKLAVGSAPRYLRRRRACSAAASPRVRCKLATALDTGHWSRSTTRPR
jgi:hypothetical protein